MKIAYGNLYKRDSISDFCNVFQNPGYIELKDAVGIQFVTTLNRACRELGV